MPHQCVRCSKQYEDGAKEILTGCSCGGRFFLFMKKQQMPVAQETMQEATAQLSPETMAQMEKDTLEIVGAEQDEKPVVLNLESIRVLEPGKFELDLVDIFQGKPLVYRLADGKYVIDVASTFHAFQKKEDD